jgi:hypothetical protein
MALAMRRIWHAGLLAMVMTPKLVALHSFHSNAAPPLAFRVMQEDAHQLLEFTLGDFSGAGVHNGYHSVVNSS